MRKDKVVIEVLGDSTPLSPSEIHNQEFSKAFLGGYDRDEVRSFLERVSNLVENLVTEIRTLKEASEADKRRVEDYAQIEATLRSALMSSQRYGEDVVELAKREAHTLVEEARLSRAQAQLEIAKLPASLTRDIKLLEQQRQRLRSDITAILDTHRNLLDSLIPEAGRRQPAGFFEAPGAGRGSSGEVPGHYEMPELETVLAPAPPEQPQGREV